MNDTTRTCSIPGCANHMHARTYCQTHYSRWRLGKDLNKPTRKLSSTPAESFQLHTKRNGECLEWTGAIHENGYGIIWTGQRVTRAHRWVYEETNGPLLPSEDVDHICGNRLCCEITHLRKATRKQNMEHRTAPNALNSSGFRGVSRAKRGKKWRVRVKHNYREYHGGQFDTLEEANQAAMRLRNKLFTHNDEDREERTPA